MWPADTGGVRVEWGLAGARSVGPGCACVVVVDVLSFTTAVTVAAERGTAVFPFPWRDDRAAEFADRHGARLAVGRRDVSARQPWSLSPAALRVAPHTDRLVLPSPNGSAISAAVTGTVVVAACLRNATAVADWILRQGWGSAEKPVAVIAAGERWPDDGLRPAVEDWLGAGAVVAALAARGAGPLSPEAVVANASWAGIGNPGAVVAECASGRELIAGGFSGDVEIAAEVDVCDVAPVLRAGQDEDGRQLTGAFVVDGRPTGP